METTEWPAQPLPQSIKDLITHFYEIVESPDESSGQRLAETIFAEDGKLIVNKRIVAGPQEISNYHHRLISSSDDDDNKATVLRKHTLHQILTCNNQGTELLLTGTVRLCSNLGLAAESPFCSRCVVEDVEAAEPRIRLWQTWVDFTPFLDLGILGRPGGKCVESVLTTIAGR